MLLALPDPLDSPMLLALPVALAGCRGLGSASRGLAGGYLTGREGELAGLTVCKGKIKIPHTLYGY